MLWLMNQTSNYHMEMAEILQTELLKKGAYLYKKYLKLRLVDIFSRNIKTQDCLKAIPNIKYGLLSLYCIDTK